MAKVSPMKNANIKAARTQAQGNDWTASANSTRTKKADREEARRFKAGLAA